MLRSGADNATVPPSRANDMMSVRLVPKRTGRRAPSATNGCAAPSAACELARTVGSTSTQEEPWRRNSGCGNNCAVTVPPGWRWKCPNVVHHSEGADGRFFTGAESSVGPPPPPSPGVTVARPVPDRGTGMGAGNWTGMCTGCGPEVIPAVNEPDAKAGTAGRSAANKVAETAIDNAGHSRRRAMPSPIRAPADRCVRPNQRGRRRGRYAQGAASV